MAVPSRRAGLSAVSSALLPSLVAATLLGILLAGARIAVTHAPIVRWPRAIAGWTLTTGGYVPAMLAVAWAWRYTTARPRLFASGIGAIALVTTLLHPVWAALVVDLFGGTYGSYSERFVGWLDTNLLVVTAIVAGHWALDQQSRAERALRDYAALRASTEDARLQILTLQLQPHFIFNTLNLISELAYRDARAAAETLADLRSLFVESLAHAFRRVTTLADELRFVEAYLAIQRRRFRDRLRVAVDVSPSLLDAAVPHLLLQPLVENALVHGFSSRVGDGAVTVSARRHANRLLLRVTDDGVGPPASAPKEGFGLANTRLRLEQLYRDDYTLTLEPGSGGGAVSTVVLPFRHAKPRAENGAADDTIDSDTPGDGEVASPPPARRLPARAVVVVAWLAIALVWTQIDAAARRLGAPRPSTSLVLWTNIVGASLWIALTPFVARMARYFDLSAGWSLLRAGGHLIAALCVASVHVASWIALTELLVPAADNPLRRDAGPWFTWDVMAYFAVVALCVAARLAARREQRALAASTGRENLRRARISALRFRLQPRLLVQCLDALADHIETDPRRAERAIARMGRLLRLLLETSASEFVDVDDELALLEAYEDVVRASDARGLDSLYDVDVREVGPERPAIAAVTLAPLAAAIGGRLTSISIAEDGAMLSISVHADNHALDPARIDELSRRLSAAYGMPITIPWARDGSGRVVAGCALPRRSLAMLARHDDWLELKCDPAIA